MESNRKVYLVTQHGMTDDDDPILIAAYSSQYAANQVVESYNGLVELGACEADTWLDVVDVPFYPDHEDFLQGGSPMASGEGIYDK